MDKKNLPNVKQLLKENKIKQTLIAKKAKVTKSMVSHVVAGKHPQSIVRDVIATELKINKDSLWP